MTLICLAIGAFSWSAVSFPGMPRPQLGEHPDNPADPSKKPVPRNLPQEDPNPTRGAPGNLQPILKFKETPDHKFEILESDPRLGDKFKPGTTTPTPPNPPDLDITQ